MKAILISVCLAVLGVLGLNTSASAQGVGIYVGPGPSYYYDDPDYRYVERAPRPRYYSAPRYEDDYVVTAPRRSGGCGTYYYWDGEQCVDARWKRSTD
jgi:hypothetical protein